MQKLGLGVGLAGVVGNSSSQATTLAGTHEDRVCVELAGWGHSTNPFL